MPVCPDCGTQVSEDEDTRFCPECGRPLAIGQAVKGKSKKKLAGIIVACIIAIIVIIVIATRPPTPLTQTYTLTINISPSGVGFVYPSGGEYESGAQVTLTATPASGYTFDYWSGSASGTTSTITITMDSDVSLTAHFKTIPTVPEVLFSDDFSDENSGWVTYDEYDGLVAYLSGCLYIKDYTAQEGTMFGESQRYFTDFILEVETWLVDGTDYNWHIVGCRFSDEDNYYTFGISADGYYGIAKCVDAEQTFFVGPTYSSYINQGVGAVNLIHIECIGSSLSLSVNGHVLATVTDTTFTGGDIALAANAQADTFTEVAFDNIMVTKPSETIPTVPTVLFSDDFSDESSGWVTYDEYDGWVAYLNGCLYVKDYAAYEGIIWGESQRYFTDFILEVETWLVGGTDDNWHSVICRCQDEDNQYSFDISADGYYEIQKWVDGYVTNFIVPTYSAYIHQGQGVTNLIHIECIGSSLSLSVNGHLLWEGMDVTFSGGDIALAANALAGTFTEVAFDNIIVTNPSETIPTVPEVLFSDDFSDETSVWDTFSDENGSVSYENGWLHLVNYSTASFATYAFVYQYFTDFILEVETKLVGGTDNNWHTVICRNQDDYNYYDFGISADGYYAIVKFIDGDQVPLTGSTPIYSSYINQGVDAVNLIHIECIGSSLSLSVNEHVLTTITDATFSDGDIALATTSLGGSFTEIAFDNIIITEP
jgi:uncharacterized repeat protein (TIGR02543 family)